MLSLSEALLMGIGKPHTDEAHRADICVGLTLLSLSEAIGMPGAEGGAATLRARGGAGPTMLTQHIDSGF
ncbi:MAG: hypothetical protein LIP03_08570 [Bacteroidales bacterium]|nr:hypothetical protein [Bacteroidales bacterium]